MTVSQEPAFGTEAVDTGAQGPPRPLGGPATGSAGSARESGCSLSPSSLFSQRHRLPPTSRSEALSSDSPRPR